MAIKFNRVGGYIGAEVSGVDLTKPNGEDVYIQLRDGLCQYGVLFFRDQFMDVEQFMRFGQGFGELYLNKSGTANKLEGYPNVEDMRKEAHEETNIGDEWHTDQSQRENPCWMTGLHGVDIPEFGGDTSFLHAGAAYDSLPQHLKDVIADLRAEHSHEFLMRGSIERQGNKDGRFDLSKATARYVHPVVRPHPLTGRKILYVNPSYTSHFEGWTRDDSKALLDVLYKHALRQEYICRLKWRPGTVAVWDNWQTWHYASNDYHGQRREMRRLMVQTPAEWVTSKPRLAEAI